MVLDSEVFDWLAWVYPSPYTAAHRFGIVIMAHDGVFMRVDVNAFLKTMCAQLFLKTEGGNIGFSKYPAMCKHGLRVDVILPQSYIST